MTRLRIVLVLGVLVVAAVGSVATAWVVTTEAPRALQNVLAVQAGTLLALAVTVFALLAPTVARLDDLIEALRAFARGERHTRVHPVDFAGLADVARAVNDVGASLCENDDPNLGPVQRKVRATPPRPPSEEPRPSLHQPERTALVRPPTPVRRPVITDGDVVGEVRTRQRVKDDGAATPPAKPSPPLPRPPIETTPSRAEAAPSREPPVATPPAGVEVVDVASSSVESAAGTTPPTESPRLIGESEGVSDPRVSRKNRKKAKRAAALAAKSSIPHAAIEADEPDESTDSSSSSEASDEAESGHAVEGVVGVVVSASPPDQVDKASAIMASTRPPVSAEGPPTVIEPAPAAMPSRDELQRLFDEFRREKRAAGQGDSIDVDFDAFAETIVAESERLVLEHRCRGVRFEVAVADGEVSLRPRLLR